MVPSEGALTATADPPKSALVRLATPSLRKSQRGPSGKKNRVSVIREAVGLGLILVSATVLVSFLDGDKGTEGRRPGNRQAAGRNARPIPGEKF